MYTVQSISEFGKNLPNLPPNNHIIIIEEQALQNFPFEFVSRIFSPLNKYAC